MAELVAFFTNNGVPLTSPANTPTIRIRRIDTQVLVVTDDAMTEIGDGLFSYTFTTDPTLEYTVRADGDPTSVGQVTATERYKAGTISGITVFQTEINIPFIQALVAKNG